MFLSWKNDGFCQVLFASEMIMCFSPLFTDIVYYSAWFLYIKATLHFCQAASFHCGYRTAGFKDSNGAGENRMGVGGVKTWQSSLFSMDIQVFILIKDPQVVTNLMLISRLLKKCSLTISSELSFILWKWSFQRSYLAIPTDITPLVQS